MTPRRTPTSREPETPFHGLVGRLDRRLRIAAAWRDLSWAAVAVTVAMVAPRLVGEGTPWLTAVAAVAGVFFVVARFVRGSDLPRAAAAGDRAAELHDELTSAQWFHRRQPATDWEELQVERARDRAGGLDADGLVSIRPHRRAWASFAAFGLAAVVLPLTQGALIPESVRARIAAGLSDFAEDSMVASQPAEEPEEVASARDEARSPEEILAELRAGELRLPDPADDAAGGADAALAAAMEERGFTETSEEVAAALAGLAEALDSADAETASEWLEGLSEAMRTASSPEELAALLEALEAGAEGDALAAAANEMMELMEGGLSAEEAFEQLAENLQSMEGEGMAAPGEAGGEQMPFPGDGDGGGQPQAGEGGEPAGGMPQGAAGMSGQVQMVAAEGQMGAPIPMDAGPAGNMTGPGGGGESDVFGASTSLEVQLELEAIPPTFDEEPVPEQMIERQSRREDASVDYDSVTSLTEYADEAVVTRTQVPAGLRALVRAYFLLIRETAVSPEEAEGANDP